MKRVAVAVAHPNIALSKYWGKREGEGNIPAVPSLSVTLDGLTTTTRVTFDDALSTDMFVLDGATNADRAAVARVTELLDRVRSAAGLRAGAVVVSRNDFPTASGLASSASGFAALAVAAASAAGLALSTSQLADLARQSSASAARSLFGGFVELDGRAAAPVAPPHHVDWRVLVCVTTEGPKALSSRDGMLRTAGSSPYYRAWLEEAPRIHAALKEAVLAGDLAVAGPLVERSALAMHAAALAAGVVYVSGVTLETLAAVRAVREDGTLAFATMDAGPHVKCLVAAADADRVADRLGRVPGVLRVLTAAPGEGARIVSNETLKTIPPPGSDVEG